MMIEHRSHSHAYQENVATTDPTSRKSTNTMNNIARNIPTNPRPYANPHAIADTGGELEISNLSTGDLISIPHNKDANNTRKAGSSRAH